jgi:hypothetical protein
MHPGALLRSRRFGPFFWTQFLCALNDNVFKNALVILFAFGVAASALSPDVLVNVAGGIFVLPFFLFPPPPDARRQAREDAHHPGRQAARDRDHVLWRARVRTAQRAAAAGGVVPHGDAFGAVRPGQVQHPPAAPARGGAGAGNALIEMGTFLAILVSCILGGAGGDPRVGCSRGVTIGLAVVVDESLRAGGSRRRPALRIRDPLTEAPRRVRPRGAQPAVSARGSGSGASCWRFLTRRDLLSGDGTW